LIRLETEARTRIRHLTTRQALNTLRNEAEFRLQSEVLGSLPQNVDIVLAKACNLACTFCVDYETPGAKRISIESFEKIARQLFPTARLVSICSGGEPYLHKGLVPMGVKAIDHRRDRTVAPPVPPETPAAPPRPS
jgi:sulfatase maturation enzyme AslB (radical SAM superfamily)